MVCLHAGSRLRVLENIRFAIAALPVLALAQFALIAPASAHHLHHYRHVAHHRAGMMVADSGGFDQPSGRFAGDRAYSGSGFYNGGRAYGDSGFYNYAPDNYAPAYQQQNGWRARHTEFNNGGFNNGGFGQNSYGSFNVARSYESRRGASPEIDGMASSAASSAGIPASLVARVIKRESGGNPRAVSKGNYGLMQIRLGTARAMGYTGSAEGLLDPQTNMTYAVKYLAGAYRAAGGNEDRAVALYARGYYGAAKAQGFSPYETAQPRMQYASYRHVADASYGNSGFGFGQQYGEQNYYGNGTRMIRVRHYHRRRVTS